VPAAPATIPAPGEELIVPPGGVGSAPRTWRPSFDEFAALPAAQQASIKRFGRLTRLVLNDGTLNAATNANIVPNNPDRVSLLIQNTGQANNLTAVGDATLGVTQGSVLAPNGAYSSDIVTDGEAVTRSVFGISTAGTTWHSEETIGYGPLIILPPGVAGI